ncbi:hypothetical protein SAMN05421752_11545 [Natronorubrum thiooxidans]|uniref:Uncharacterized protein n=1 Tax=Natronorubrum thiooxidans TaxID=308853 RepID=A0A1N7GTC5_9EURY|nr:hypothetical protein SAMN05421752_11545 [Natronorubrum thiooxidans]
MELETVIELRAIDLARGAGGLSGFNRRWVARESVADVYDASSSDQSDVEQCLGVLEHRHVPRSSRSVRALFST